MLINNTIRKNKLKIIIILLKMNISIQNTLRVIFLEYLEMNKYPQSIIININKYI